MRKAREKTRTILFSIAVLMLASGIASAAETFGFDNITSNNIVNADAGEAQLSVVVNDAGGGLVEFLFLNSGPAPSSITDIYFDDNLGVLSGTMAFIESAGVDFEQGASPGNLPGGNDPLVEFSATGALTADSEAPSQPNGVDPGESLSITLSGDYDDVVSQLTDGDLRIGIHVQGFADGGSEAFVTTVVPVPGAVALGAIGLGMVRLLRTRKK